MSDSLEKRFARLSVKYRDDPRVTEGTGFGASPGLKVDLKIFAMLVNSELVVKLPSDVIDGLLEEGIGKRLQIGSKRPMREWLSIPGDHSRRWPRLVGQAHDFVGAPRSS